MCIISVEQLNKVLLKALPSTDTYVEGRACEYIESSNCSVTVLLSIIKWKTSKKNGRLVWRSERLPPVQKNFNVQIDKITNALELKIKNSLQDLSIFSNPPEVKSVNNNYGTCDGQDCNLEWVLNCCDLYFNTYLKGNKPVSEAGEIAAGTGTEVIQDTKESIRGEAINLTNQFNSQPASSRALGDPKYKIGNIEESGIYDAVYSKVMQMFDSGTWEAAMNIYSIEQGYPAGPWPENTNQPTIIGGLVAVPISAERKGQCGAYSSITDDQDQGYFLNSSLDKEIDNVMYIKEYSISQPNSINGTVCNYSANANFAQINGSTVGSENFNVYIGI